MHVSPTSPKIRLSYKKAGYSLPDPVDLNRREVTYSSTPSAFHLFRTDASIVLSFRSRHYIPQRQAQDVVRGSS